MRQGGGKDEEGDLRGEGATVRPRGERQAMWQAGEGDRAVWQNGAKGGRGGAVWQSVARKRQTTTPRPSSRRQDTRGRRIVRAFSGRAYVDDEVIEDKERERAEHAVLDEDRGRRGVDVEAPQREQLRLEDAQVDQDRREHKLHPRHVDARPRAPFLRRGGGSGRLPTEDVQWNGAGTQ